MAMSPSPQLSPSLGTAQRLDRRSDTPPAQPLSKRDKRRTQLLDRLNEITMQFNNNKDQYYRNQLQAIQIDTGLILHADPYRDDPLNDFGEDVQEMIGKATSNDSRAMMAIIKGDVASVAGKIYSEFSKDVNDAMESRDTCLTMHKSDYERKLAELHTHNSFMLKLAEEEHKALSSTLRDRLINSVTMRRFKLSKEKDELYNIGESNALLLNPNQFTVVHPSSPGGLTGKRATRHRRDMDDLSGYPDSNKRKRKAVDDAGSPVPTRRHLDNGFSTSIWTTEHMAKAMNKGTHSPLYSIDKLFTEKELAMIYNQAAQGAYSLVLLHKARYLNNDSDSASNDGDAQNNGDPEKDTADSPPSAPLMDRQPSHATRSTRGAGLGLGGTIGRFGTATGIDILSDLTQHSNFLRLSGQISSNLVPKMPPLLSTVMAKAYVKETANQPAPISGEELVLDKQNIERAQKINDANGKGKSLEFDRDMLAAAVAEPGKYAIWMPNEKIAASRKKAKLKPNSTAAGTVLGGAAAGNDGDDSQPGNGPLGGVPMSKQSSFGGSEIGGGLGSVPMSRTGTGDGSNIGLGFVSKKRKAPLAS